MDDWRSPAQRNAVIQKLEAVMKESGSSSPNFQNPVDLEKAFFEKSKSKDEYQTYFRNTVLMLSRNKASQPQGMIPGRTNQSMQMVGQHNPLSYGHNFSQYGGGTGMNPGGNQVPNGSFPSGGGGGGMGMPSAHRPQQPPQYTMYPPGVTPGSGVHMQQHYPGMGVPQSGYSRPPSNYPAAHMGYPQPGVSFTQPGMVTGQRPPMHGGSIMRPGMMATPTGMQPPGVMMRPSGMQGSVPNGQHTFMMDNGGQQVHSVPNPSYSSGMRTINPNPVYSSGVSSATNTQVPTSHPGSVPPFNISSSASATQGGPNVPPSATNVPPTSGTSAGGSESGQLHQPMPPNLAESTSSANPPTPSMFASAASPAPPTPIYPVSPATVGAQGVPSNQPQPAMTPEENEAYMRKLNELQKYIPVMSEWINRLSRDEKKTDQYMKLKNLYNLLQYPTKRVALHTLMKCETALEKMFDKNPDKISSASRSSESIGSVPPLSIPPSSTVAGPSSSSTTTAPPHSDPSVPEPKLSNPQQSQSLLDFKVTRSPPPSYANLKMIIPRTGSPFDRLPAAKRQRLLSDVHTGEGDEDDLSLPANVKKELMHLSQFDIKVEPKRDQHSREIILTCSINSQCHLPKVPSLTIVLPHEYPAVSPLCDLTHYRQVASPFIKRVGTVLSETMSKRVGSYSFSSLLDCWVTSLLTSIAEVLDKP